MNKLLIVLLAVCLVSVHAFVKRDAPATSDLEAKVADMKTKLEDFTKSFSEQAAKVFDPEVIKKSFNEMVDNAKQTIDKFKPASQPKA
ncbi:hypothetical protein PYW07_016647 [Mythimna separata]|uniref:Uncharacterized protein n=1 Tax=Mythimna separata TaxID=271217 RepID=A0AAD7YM16_MYTSE|nr:hypothetical protein PYW07_016647 [Mythimna separata]